MAQREYLLIMPFMYISYDQKIQPTSLTWRTIIEACDYTQGSTQGIENVFLYSPQIRTVYSWFGFLDHSLGHS